MNHQLDAGFRRHDEGLPLISLKLGESLQAWGPDFIHVQLPMALVLMEGLSGKQREVIARDHGSFAVPPDAAVNGCDIRCHAGRLLQPLHLPLERFKVNGQYAPLKRRKGSRIELIGFDFVGGFVRGGKEPVVAELSVAEEEQLTWPSVLENFLRTVLAHHVLDRGGVLLHSAGILHQGFAYLFFGRSSAGKTTLACKAFEAGASVLSDDINLVIEKNGGYHACKVPFTGEFGRRAEKLPGIGSFPIGGLALLEKAPKLAAAPVRPAEGLAGLLTCCPFVNNDPEEVPALMHVLAELIRHRPVVRMGVSRDDSFEAVMDSLMRCCYGA